MSTISIILALALSTVNMDMVSLPINRDVKVTLTPGGKAELKREGNLTRLRVEIDKLRPPAALGTAFNTYVVWVVSPEGVFENLGELSIDGDKGVIDATARLTQLGIFITAEPHYMVDRPSSTVVYRNQSPPGELRRMTVPIEVGAYDYSTLKRPPGANVSASVVQARTAFLIAQEGGAERVAGMEFRQARVALDSMEELLTRSAPLDTLWPTANEAIRWAQRAVTAAREKAAEAALQTARSEIEPLKAAQQRLDARISELIRDQAAASEEIRTLRATAAGATADKDQLTAQRDQAEARARNAERELADLKQKQQQLQPGLSLTLRADFFDGQGLTDVGRDALIRISNVAQVIPGPILLEGTENALKAATEFLLLAGVPQDRIITRR
jgi:hypothetical protein